MLPSLLSGIPGKVAARPGFLLPGRARPAVAAITCQQIAFPSSSWVHAFILTCDDKLAVWFKRGGRRRHHVRTGGVPGVCCLYPTSSKALYDLAVVWWSAGHFVHQFLYKILPYQLVAPPPLPCAGCGGCCPEIDLLDPKYDTLHVTFTGGVSGSAILTRQGPGAYVWSGSAVLCAGASSNIFFSARTEPYCRIDLLTGETGSCVGNNLSVQSVSCQPFVAVLSCNGEPPGCCNGAAFLATVTT